MFRDSLDLLDARDVEGDEIRLVPDRLGALSRNDADLGQCVAGVSLDLEPNSKSRLRLPDGGHFSGNSAESLSTVLGGGNLKETRPSISIQAVSICGRRRSRADGEQFAPKRRPMLGLHIKDNLASRRDYAKGRRRRFGRRHGRRVARVAFAGARTRCGPHRSTRRGGPRNKFRKRRAHRTRVAFSAPLSARSAEARPYALNLLPEAHYDFASLPSIAPWLYRYYRESSPERAAGHAARRPLVERCLIEHEALIDLAKASDLLRKTGWIKLYRTPKTLEKGVAEAERLRAFDLRIDVLDSAGVLAREPDLSEKVAGAVHFLDTASISDPSRLAQAYADLFTVARRALRCWRRADPAAGSGRAMERRDAGGQCERSRNRRRARTVVGRDLPSARL